MSAPTSQPSQLLTPPPGIDMRKWGPDLLPVGTMYIFKGERHVVPKDWKNPQEMMVQLAYVEQLEWKLALPEQRQELFKRKYVALTKDLPLDWKIVTAYTVSGVIFVVFVYWWRKSQVAKL